MQAFIDVTAENDQLRQTIQEMEKCASNSQNHLSQLHTQLDEMRRDCRNQVLKARASMQGKIRDLEDKISAMNTGHTNKIEHLNANIETLRADREWTLEENARLLKLLDSYKQKLSDAWETMGARQEENKKLRSKLDNDRVLIVQLADDLEEAQQTANILLEQKISVLDDVERLKEALEAQDQYIELLEKDTVIYEEHVGLLRDSLGTSKAERKALIRSKAYEAKLRALEREKEQMNRRSNDEKLHIKALSLKISLLEAERTVLISRNDELESQLIQLGENVSTASVVASSTATVTPAAIEIISNVVNSGSAFKPVHTHMMMQVRRNDGRQAATEVLQWPMSENVATAYEHQYDKKLVNNMRAELDIAREEYSLVQEKIVYMGYVNFELEHQLKDAREKLEEAEIRARQAEEQAEEARRNCAQQEKYQKSLQSEFLVKFKEVNDLKEELVLKNEQLNARMTGNNKRNEEIKLWRLAVDEMEAVHKEIRMLEKQLNDEKAAMKSKWAEVRTILLERKEDMSRKTSNAESVAGGEQNTTNKLKEMINTISDLKNTVDKQAKQLEFDKTEKRKFKAVIRQLQADKRAVVTSSALKSNDGEQHVGRHEAQIIGLQRQRDFMDRELTLLCTLNNSKDVLIQSLKAKLEGICSEKLELSDLRSENDKNEMHAKQLQTDCGRFHLQLQLSPEQYVDALPSNAGTHHQTQLQQTQQEMEFMEKESEIKDLSMAAKSANVTANENVNIEMRVRMEKLTEAMQQRDIEMQKILNENEALKIKCVESTAALNLLSGKLERRSQEKDAIIEMLQSQHTYLTQTILLNEKTEKQLMTSPTISRGTNTDIEPKCKVLDASTIMEEADSGPILIMRHHQIQTGTDFHLSETLETRQKLTSGKVIHNDNSVLESENQEVCQCVNKSNQMHENLTDDVRQLMILNAELETAVEVLKGEIWTLNEQLKGSLVDREDLSDKLCELSQRHEEEIERARERERDLEEQKDMAEKSQRQAALAENESNLRLVEWQEKSAQMENSRIELENAYAKLSEYYQQLQQAYNALYAQFNTCKIDSNTQTIMDSNTFKTSEEFAEKIQYLKSELAQQKTELKRQGVEFQHVRNLLREYLYVTLKNVRDLREMNLKLFKDVIVDSVPAVQAQLHKSLKEVHSYAEEVIVKWFKEKELKDVEIAVAVQQLMNGVPVENISQTQGLSLSVIVDAVNKKFLEKKSENTALKNDLWNKRSDKAALEMKIQQSASEKKEGPELKIKELEDLLQVTQFSLSEHAIKCQQLQIELNALRSATDQNGPRAAKYGTTGSDAWNCSTPCTICRELKQSKQPAPTPQLQLAILAARLTTKIADNDALFRCNAELAQTNLRLQNEVEELREQMTRYNTSSSNIDTSATNQQSLQQQHIPKQPSNQSIKQKAMYIEEKELIWETGAKLSISEFQIAYQQPSSNQQIAGFTMTNEIQMTNLIKPESQKQDSESLEKKLNATKEYSKELEEKNEVKNNAERLDKCLEVSAEYCLERGNKVEQPETELETRQHEDAKHKQKLEVTRITNEELLSLKSQNMQLTGFVRNPKQELELEKLGEKLQCENEGIHHRLVGFTEEFEKQKEVAKGKLEKDEHKAKDSDWILDGAPGVFQTLLEEQMQDIPRDSTIKRSRMQILRKLEEQLQQKEIELQKLQEENRSLNEQLKSQQQLIEGLEKKLAVTQGYSMILQEKNMSMKQEIIDRKKKYEEVVIEKSRLTGKVENEVKAELLEEITVLKRENEGLVEELTRKQAFLDEEKRNMKAELVNLECQLANREILLQELMTELKHTQEENIQIRRQLDNYGAQMSELHQKNEVTQEFRQQLVEAQKKAIKLERKLNQVVEQNGLLKNGEQKLMDALMVSNKQLAEMESKNERLESEIFNLQASLLKTAEKAKKTDRPEKSVMHDANAVVEIHGETRISSATMQLHNAFVEESAQEMQTELSALKKSFEPALQRTTHCFQQNDDKLRRRKGGGGGFQGAEKI
ncbi:hypothetical protein, variant [Loa loa]|nr:hypothetical protein, variant [Loa loa]EJD76266.1 hypothetical protein, variant [Loa loa]